jgi:hypothetical protein
MSGAAIWSPPTETLGRVVTFAFDMLGRIETRQREAAGA